MRRMMALCGLLALTLLIAACQHADMSWTHDVYTPIGGFVIPEEYTLTIDQVVYRAEEVSLLPQEQLPGLHQAVQDAIDERAARAEEGPVADGGIPLFRISSAEWADVCFYTNGPWLEVALAHRADKVKITPAAAEKLAELVTEIGGSLREIRKTQNQANPPST